MGFEAEKGCLGGLFYCTIRPIGQISLIRPISYGCTYKIGVFAARRRFVFKFAKSQRAFPAEINSLKVCSRLARGCGVVPDGRVQGQRRVAPGMKSCRAVIG